MKKLLEVDLHLSKSTKGTHVLANEEVPISLYVPRAVFAATGCRPEAKFRLLIEEVS